MTMKSSASRSVRASRVARAALAAALLFSSAGADRAAAEGATPSGVLVVSREEVLAESQVARALSDAEARLTAELQAEVDTVKTRLSVEEQELTILRNELPKAEFDRRVQVFDQQVRAERRRTQGRAAALQNAFRKARSRLVDAMIPILVQISRERGAAVVLDREQIFLAHPSADVTEEVIRRLDAEVPMPAIPSLDDLEPGEPQPETGIGSE